MGLDSSTHRECPLPKYWGSMGISPCPSGTGAVPRLKSWFLLQAGEKKIACFNQVTSRSNVLLRQYFLGEDVASACLVFVAMAVSLAMSTHWYPRAQQEGRCSAIIPYSLNGTKSKGVWRRARKNIFSGAFCLRGTALDLLQRKGNITFTGRKMPLPPSLLSLFPSGLRVWTFFIFREVISTMEELRKTEAKWCILFCVEWNSSAFEEKKKPCLFPFLGKKPLLFAYSDYFEALSFMKRQRWNSTELIMVSQKFSLAPIILFFFYSLL